MFLFEKPKDAGCFGLIEYYRMMDELIKGSWFPFFKFQTCLPNLHNLIGYTRKEGPLFIFALSANYN